MGVGWERNARHTEITESEEKDAQGEGRSINGELPEPRRAIPLWPHGELSYRAGGAIEWGGGGRGGMRVQTEIIESEEKDARGRARIASNWGRWRSVGKRR